MMILKTFEKVWEINFFWNDRKKRAVSEKNMNEIKKAERAHLFSFSIVRTKYNEFFAVSVVYMQTYKN